MPLTCNIQVRVIVHGFGSNCGLVWIYEMRTALMAVVSCFFFASHPTYPTYNANPLANCSCLLYLFLFLRRKTVP